MLGKQRAVRGRSSASDARSPECVRAGGPAPSRCRRSTGSPMRSSASSTTWRRCRPGARIPGTCSTTPRPVSRSWSRRSPNVVALRPTATAGRRRIAGRDRPRVPSRCGRASPAAVAAQQACVAADAGRRGCASRADGGRCRVPGRCSSRKPARTSPSSQSLFPQWESNPLDAQALARRAPRVPHAEGQRPHGRRAARRRVRLEHRKPAESRHQPDAAALAGHRGRRARCRRRDAAARRRARARRRAGDRRERDREPRRRAVRARSGRPAPARGAAPRRRTEPPQAGSRAARRCRRRVARAEPDSIRCCTTSSARRPRATSPSSATTSRDAGEAWLRMR